MSHSSLLDALWRSGALRTLDHALAQSLRRLDPATPDTVLAAAALASLAVAEGHAGFDLASPRTLIDAPDIPWPDADAWRRDLAASRWVAVPTDGAGVSDAGRPLVLEDAPGAPGLLYLRRYREYERRVAAGLQRIAKSSSDAGGVDLVTGGPGTGKTTTIARMLVQLVEQSRAAGRKDPRIALAAPTGRAAERMAESVRNALQAIAAEGTDAGVIAALPTSGSTLHRLLGTIPGSPRFRHHADNPLPFDVVVVDEASMIDLPLMAKLVEAVADGARLVLLGDPDQLPSVEAGDVLSGILRAAPDTALPRRSDVSRDPNPNEETVATDVAPTARQSPFPARHIHLVRNWRQDHSLHLAPLATAVREGDVDTALSLLRDGTLSNVRFHEGLADPLQTHRDPLLAHWRSLADAATPAEALAFANRLRILTAVREGPQGARTLNTRIEAMLGESGGAAANTHFHGRLILVTENSHRHRLFNGDIGICFRGDDGVVLAWFPGDTPDAPRPFHPAALPAHDSAFAMTVHKAQGSEFDEVWLVLPERDNRVLSRELVYTGMTRARSVLHMGGSAEVLANALARHTRRWSGLGRRLGR